MPQSPLDRAILGGLAALIAASAANAQSFNIDLSTFGTVTPAPPPASTYGAAAAQPGVWNNITNPSAFLEPLVNLAGAATPATIDLVEGLMGAFSGANADATPANSNSEFLLDDGWDPFGTEGFIIIRDLAPGLYNIYTYSVAPASNTDLTRVTIIDAIQGPQIAGGALPNPFLDTYAVGLTHTFHTISVGSDKPVFIFIDDPDGQAQTINGLQIQLVPTPSALALLGLSGLVGSRGGCRRR